MTVSSGESEQRRLRALRRLDILDTPRVASFERLGELARAMFDVPMAFVALVDEDRLWLKGSCGLAPDTLPREDAFCRVTIGGNVPLVVPDLRADPRFSASRMVDGPLGLRFYAGVPLALRRGVNLGTFCILDTEPRVLSKGDLAHLRRLAALAVDALRLHRTVGRLKAEIDRQRRTEAALKRQSAELWRRQTVSSQTERMAHVGSWDYDIETGRLSWSDEVRRIFGVAPGQEMTLEAALSFYPEQARTALSEAFAHAIATHGAYELQLPFTAANGELRWIETIGQVEARSGRPTRVFGICQDVTDRKSVETRMWYLANHDTLTELPNRALFQDRLEQALLHARRQNTMVALVLVDLDEFKAVNDSLGHDAGDAVLREQATRLVGAVRVSDTVARLGGDEFAVLLTGLTTRDIAPLLERMSARLNAPFRLGGRNVACHASLGVSFFPDHGEDAKTLVKSADLALYAAKTSGRARHEVFAPAIGKTEEHRNGVAWQVRSALAEDRIEPFYQPVIRLDTGTVSGFEALLRWRDATGSPQGPAAIASAFDDPDLAIALGERMLARIVADIGRLERDARPFGRVGWNVSEVEFRRGDLVERIIDRLHGAAIEPSRFVLEVTESVLLTGRMVTARALLMRLREAGALIALDDFGTGYASLSHLKQLPVDIIKIDQSFVRDVSESRDSAAIVEAVVGLGRSLGMEVVAEGIESLDHLRFLQGHGCPRGQGFMVARPMPVGDLDAFFREWPLRWAQIARGYARVA